MKKPVLTALTAVAAAAFMAVAQESAGNVSADNGISANNNALTAGNAPSAVAPAALPPGKPRHNLSLEDALQRSIRDNPLVQIERINTGIAKSLEADNDAAYDPRLRASYTVSERAARGIANSHDFAVSVTAPFSTGTTVEAGIGASPYSSAKDSLMNFQNSIGVTVTQALLQGRGAAANLVQLKKARLDIDIRQEELAAYAQRILADTERAYWDLRFSGEQMNIYKYSLELAQRLLYESEERLKLGGIAPIDLVAIRAEVASRERQLFDAQVSYDQKALYLKYLMNAPALWDAELALTDSASSLSTADGIAEHIEAAKMFRTDYLVAFKQAEKGVLDLVQTKNGMMPKLDAFVSLQGLTPAETFPGALIPGSGISGAVSAGLTLNYPFKNRAAQERHRRTGFSLEQQKLSIENYAKLMEYEVRSAHMEVLRARQQVATAAEVGALQAQKLEAEQDKMDAGKSTGYAVLQVQRDVVSAQLDEAQARTAYTTALISLYTKDGTLLRRRGVKF
ncbi:MAG: TolC family protein [Chitinispirillia bacterium]|nr:TolC family protein [Chitinispirillia bacterium]MCL2241717.1 TolC family protein [Chitinispirillia bacterium]